MTDALLLDKFEIFFENETGVFQEGSSVTGLVIIENTEDLTYKSRFPFQFHFLSFKTETPTKQLLFSLQGTVFFTG